MSAQKRKDEINLLPERGFESTTTGRVLVWILSTFRVIVIVTEFIVMVAFLSRFWLDAQNSDLDEKIQQRQAVLAASLNFEQQFKNTQIRLKIFSDLVNQKDEGEILKLITESLPPDIILTELTTIDKQIEIFGNTSNERGIQQLIINLNSKEEFGNFDVVKITSNIDNPTVLDFALKGAQL